MHPVLYTIPSFQISTFVIVLLIMFIVGFILGGIIFTNRHKKELKITLPQSLFKVNEITIPLKSIIITLISWVLFCIIVGYYIYENHPEISIPDFKIHTYGFTMAMSFLLAMILSYREAKKIGIEPPDIIIDLSFWVLLSAMIGARVVYMITQPEQFKRPLEIFKIWQGGLVWYGGLIGGFLAIIIFLKIHKLKLATILDIIAPYAALGYGIHRGIGCFCAGCCHGRPTTLPWGVTFPSGSPADSLYHGQPVHPTQLYMSLEGFLIFGILMVYKKYKKRDGELTWLYFMLSAVARFIIEYFRGDKIRGENVLGTPFSTSQVISILIVIVGIVLFYNLRKSSITPELKKAIPSHKNKK